MNATTKCAEGKLVKNSIEEPLDQCKEPCTVETTHASESLMTKKNDKTNATNKKILTRNKVPTFKCTRNEKFIFRNRNKKQLNRKKDIPLKIKHPQKRNLQDAHSNSEHNSNIQKTNKKSELPNDQDQLKDEKEFPLNGKHTIQNGHALTVEELDILYAKFIRDGHFRTDPKLSPFILSNHDRNNYITISMRCCDPKRDDNPTMNILKGPNGEIDSNMQLTKNLSYVNGNGNAQFFPTKRHLNNQSRMEKPLYNLKMDVNFTEPISNTFADLTANENVATISDMAWNVQQYTRNEAEIGCSGINNQNELNSFVNSNAMQFNNKMTLNGTKCTSNANSNYSNSYYQIDRHIDMNSTNCVTGPSCRNLNTNHNSHESFNTNFTCNNSLSGNTTNQANNLTTISNFPLSPINNNEWNTSQSAESGIFNESTINNFRNNPSTVDHANQEVNVPSPTASTGSTHSLPNMNNSFAIANNQSPLINRNNNFSNSGYIAPSTWNNPYTPYLNTARPYSNNTYNSFNPNYIGIAVPNVTMLNNQNYMGNNVNTWSQNMLPFTSNGTSMPLGSTSNNSETFVANSFPLQANTIPSGPNTPLPSVRTLFSQTDTFDGLSNNNNDYRINEGPILPEITKFQQNNGIPDNSTRLHANLYNNNNYTEKTYVQYVSQCKYNVQNTEFHNDELVKHIDDSHYQPDSLNQKMQFESDPNYSMGLERPGSPECVIIAELPGRESILPEITAKKSEIHQLRQALVDFTKQYTETQPMDSTLKLLP